jgi:integrase
MPRPRPPHLHHEKTRHGRLVWYVRVNKGPRVRMRAEYGTDDFWQEYRAAVDGEPMPKGGKTKAGSLAWLIERYRESSDWAAYSVVTRRQRDNMFKQVIASAGDKPYAQITEATITAGRERRKATPFQARHFLDAMRGLFAWAKEAKFVKEDPAAPVKYPKLDSGAGFPVWTEDDVTAYETRWPLGTKERVWLSVLIYTGLRRGDAVKLGRQHVRDGEATIKTEKSNFQIEVTIPLLPPLVEALNAGPTSNLVFVCGTNGKPFTKESFGNAFSEAARKAGVRKSAHGLRKIGAVRAALAGATIPQLNAMFGWTGSKMAMHYTEAADRVRLAREGHKLLSKPIPAPNDKVRASGRKK